MRNELYKSVLNQLVTGSGQPTFKCLVERSPRKEVERLKKQLKSSENWEVYGETVWDSHGNSFNGIASWDRVVSAFQNGHEYRFKILKIDRSGLRTFYAIPTGMVATFSALPGIALSASEIEIIKKMADELLQRRPISEQYIYCIHPAKESLIENRENQEGSCFDTLELQQMLEDSPVLRQIITATLAVQYRSFLDGRDIPDGVFNFVLPPKNKDIDLWFYSVLQSLTFANAPGMTTAGPITITLKDTADLQRWRCCHERLAVIQTSSGALLWPLLEELEERDRILKSGGILHTALPTVPISLTRTVLHHPQATDIQLPQDCPQLTYEQQDLLRAAMSKLVRRKHAEAVLQEWTRRRQLPIAYRTNGFTVWQDILLASSLKTWFPGPEFQDSVNKLCSDTQQQREDQERIIAEKLRQGLEFLTNVEAYNNQIIERPNSVSDWNRAVEEDALAFWYTPKSGDDKGKKLLAFSRDTLKALLRRAGCPDELYEAFLARCESQAILDSKKRTINLNKTTLNAVTFCLEYLPP